MKKQVFAALLSLVLAFTALAVVPLSAYAQQESAITVTLNGSPLDFADAQPMMINDRTMVPMRAIFEAMGANVEWIEQNQLIIATQGSKMISMMIDKPRLVIQDILASDTKIVELDVAPCLVGERTLVPARAVAESLDATVDWVDETQTVVITRMETPQPGTVKPGDIPPGQTAPVSDGTVGANGNV